MRAFLQTGFFLVLLRTVLSCTKAHPTRKQDKDGYQQQGQSATDSSGEFLSPNPKPAYLNTKYKDDIEG